MKVGHGQSASEKADYSGRAVMTARGGGGGACGDLTKYYNDYFFRVANRIEFAK